MFQDISCVCFILYSISSRTCNYISYTNMLTDLQWKSEAIHMKWDKQKFKELFLVQFGLCCLTSLLPNLQRKKPQTQKPTNQTKKQDTFLWILELHKEGFWGPISFFPRIFPLIPDHSFIFLKFFMIFKKEF